MTDREAFIIGVTAFCKDAGFDHDDTAEFARLLLMAPLKAIPIVKRASAEKRAWEFGGSWSRGAGTEPGFFGALGGGLWDIGKGLAGTTYDTAHGALGLVGYAPSKEYAELAENTENNRAAILEGQQQYAASPAGSQEAKDLRKRINEARAAGNEDERKKYQAEYTSLATGGASTITGKGDARGMPAKLRKLREAHGLPVGDEYNATQEAAKARNLMRGERRRLERDYGIGNALKTNPSDLPPEMRSTLAAIQKYYNKSPTQQGSGNSVASGTGASGGAISPAVSDPSITGDAGGANVASGALSAPAQDQYMNQLRSNNGWAAPKEQGDVADLPGKAPAVNAAQQAATRQRQQQRTSSPMVDMSTPQNDAALAAHEQKYDTEWQQSQNRMATRGGRKVPYPAQNAASTGPVPAPSAAVSSAVKSPATDSDVLKRFSSRDMALARQSGGSAVAKLPSGGTLSSPTKRRSE